MKCTNCKHYLKGGSICGLCYCFDKFESKDYPPYLDYPKERKPQNNFERLKSMSMEEMAEFIMSVEPAACPFRDDHGDDCRFTRCTDCWAEWLKQEVEDGKNTR